MGRIFKISIYKKMPEALENRNSRHLLYCDRLVKSMVINVTKISFNEYNIKNLSFLNT